MAYYDSKPSKFEANGDGSYTYRWNIKEVLISSGENEETKWQCDEVVVWAPVSSDKITEVVINSLWSKDYEQKLINDYNSAKEGIFDEQKSQESIERYMQFLSDRKAIKELIDQDCVELNII